MEPLDYIAGALLIASIIGAITAMATLGVIAARQKREAL